MNRNGGPEQLLADCQLRAVVDLFTHRWDLVVLAALHDGPHRRGALHERVGGLSDKSLTETLRRLLQAGLIQRQRFGQRPPRVDYALTALGGSLVDGPVRELGRWIHENGDALLAAQERNDSAASDFEHEDNGSAQ
ncbi:winged helix-turn-helix transcriptional regulator [Nocardia brasiliensis]|nr:helix-turn-helix domain-containing protein [Nocardia brasiliensis]